jgi:hypothetical protein
MSSLFKVLVILFVTSLVAGCKVAVIVVEGGEVQSIGSGTCAEGTICIIEVNDTSFNEVFTAVPEVGWAFVKWNTGGYFFCGDSTDPKCVLSTVGADGKEGIESIIASDQTFYIMPIFTPVNSHIISVAGKEWAQVDLFTNLPWYHMNSVCPDGVCAGILNGYDMTGWTWASIEDINTLFNYYIGSDVLGPGPEIYHEIDAEWTPAFFGDGWRSLDYIIPPGVVYTSLEGYLRNLPGENGAYIGLIGIGIEIAGLPNPGSRIGVRADLMLGSSDTRGGWFYRTH